MISIILKNTSKNYIENAKLSNPGRSTWRLVLFGLLTPWKMMNFLTGKLKTPIETRIFPLKVLIHICRIRLNLVLGFVICVKRIINFLFVSKFEDFSG